VVLEFRPVALLDLHEGWGLREAGDRFADGTLSVGQTVIVYPPATPRPLPSTSSRCSTPITTRSTAQPG